MMRLATSLFRAARRPVDRTIQRSKERRERKEEVRRRARERAEEEVRRRANLTPTELAEMVLASALGERVATRDVEELASRIARLADTGRYILALLAEGRMSEEEVAYELRKRIFKVLSEDASTDP